jgi:hypothetical protein
MIENQCNLSKQFKIQFTPNPTRWRPMCGGSSWSNSGESCRPSSPKTMGPLWLSSPLKKTATPVPCGEISLPSKKQGSLSIPKRTAQKAAGASWTATHFTCPSPFRTGYVPMGGRFGKYGDVKRKERLRKSRLSPRDLRERAKDKTSDKVRKRKKRGRDQRAGA